MLAGHSRNFASLPAPQIELLHHLVLLFNGFHFAENIRGFGGSDRTGRNIADLHRNVFRYGAVYTILCTRD